MRTVEELAAGFDMIPAESHTDFINKAQTEIDTMADALGVESVGITVPEYGFLREPLTPEEVAMLDGELGDFYANQGVEFQDGCAQLPVEESDERMVDLHEIFDREGLQVFYTDKKYHAKSGERWANKDKLFWTREQIAERLVRVVKGLGSIGLTLKFEDVFRPEGVQGGLIRRRITEIIKPWESGMTYNQTLAEVRSKTGDSPIVSGHTGGASVDARLCSLDGKYLPLGHDYPGGGAHVALEFPFLTKEQWRTRQLFAAAMRLGGLVVYPWEDWHASYGDTLAARGEGYVARYGPLKGFDKETGAVVPYDPSEYFTPFVSEEEFRNLSEK